MYRTLFLLFIVWQAQALEINRVIFATDANPEYLEFWPLVARIWKTHVGVQPTLALVANDSVQVDESVGDVVRFEPLTDIPTAQQAQIIRLFLPFYFKNDGCIIADIDMLGFDRHYFVDQLAGFDDSAFIVFRDAAYSPLKQRYPMCYVAAKGHTFAHVFGIHTPNDIQKTIKSWFAQGYGWHTDERCMYKKIQGWCNVDQPTERGPLGQLYDYFWRMMKHVFWLCQIFQPDYPCAQRNVVFLGGRNIKRIDRINWGYDAQALKSGAYQDAHLPRPYSAHKNEIDQLLSDLNT